MSGVLGMRFREIGRSGSDQAFLLLAHTPIQSFPYGSDLSTQLLEHLEIQSIHLAEKHKRKAINYAGERKEEQEVYNLGKALDFLEECEARKLPITEELIKKLHAIIRVIPSGRRQNCAKQG